MITIKDVAKRAGVSITSASYALNGTGTISAATRKRVLDAAAELNYHPNAFARHLKMRKTRTIGVFIARFGGSFYEEILEGIHDAVLKTDYELLVCPESRDVRKMLVHRQVDGAIIFDTKIKSDLLIRLASKIFPIIVLDRNLEAEHILSLLVDNQQGARLAFNYLFDQGARLISFVSGAYDSYDNSERMQAFLAEADNHQIDVPCYNGNFTEASGYEAAQTMFENSPLPEAVFCANDQMAIGLIRFLKEHQVKVPNDVAVIGFDDIPLAKFFLPPLSTIRVSRFSWGALATTQLIDFLENGNPFQPTKIPVELIQRDSSRLTDHAALKAKKISS
jgi:LacI family transcriptional regulator